VSIVVASGISWSDALELTPRQLQQVARAITRREVATSLDRMAAAAAVHGVDRKNRAYPQRYGKLRKLISDTM